MIEIVKWSLLQFNDRGRPCKLCNNKKSVKYKVTVKHSNGSKSRMMTFRACNKCMGSLLAAKKESLNENS